MMRIIKNLALLTIGTVIMVGNTYAVDKDFCEKNPDNYGNDAVIFCAQKALKASNADVAAAYKKKLKDFKNNDKTSLVGQEHATGIFRKAQKSWESYKNYSCKANYLYAGNGTIRPIDLSYCLIDINKTRILELTHKTNAS